MSAFTLKLNGTNFQVFPPDEIFEQWDIKDLDSNLASGTRRRYKIYFEGQMWNEDEAILSPTSRILIKAIQMFIQNPMGLEIKEYLHLMLGAVSE